MIGITPQEWRERHAKPTKVLSQYRRKYADGMAEKRILEIVHARGRIMPMDLARALGLTRTMTRVYTRQMIQRGELAQTYYRRELYIPKKEG